MQKPKCPSCGTHMDLKGGKKGEIKEMVKLMIIMQSKQTYVCPKCSYEVKRQSLLLK